MTDWPTHQLGDLCEIFDGPHATPAKTDSGPIFLGIDCLDDGRLNLSAAEHVSRDDYRRWTRRVIPRVGDVVFSYETRLGAAARIPEGLECCLGRRMGLLRFRDGLADPRFLLYSFLGPDFQEVIRSRTVHGSTVDRILLSEIGSFPIAAPHLQVQRGVASILGCLDDKIDLNHRTNETIQALGMAYVNLALLDDPIEVMIADAFFVNPEQVSPGGLPDPLLYIDIGSVSRGTLNEQITVAAAVAPSRARRLVRQGDTIISTVRPGRGAFFFIDQPDPRLVVSTGFAVLRPKRWPPGVSYFAATNPRFIQKLDQNATGAAYPAVPTSVFEGLVVLMPAEPLVKELEQSLDPLLRMFHANLRQNETLARLRDALLPKLMSGEIRLKEADKAAAEAL